jgi:hypothetical protein
LLLQVLVLGFGFFCFISFWSGDQLVDPLPIHSFLHSFVVKKKLLLSLAWLQTGVLFVAEFELMSSVKNHPMSIWARDGFSPSPWIWAEYPKFSNQQSKISQNPHLILMPIHTHCLCGILTQSSYPFLVLIVIVNMPGDTERFFGFFCLFGNSLSSESWGFLWQRLQC